MSVTGLALTLIPSLLLFLNVLDPVQMKNYMLIGTVLWFSGAIPWLGKKKAQS
jgi:hypothetical protein